MMMVHVPSFLFQKDYRMALPLCFLESLLVLTLLLLNFSLTSSYLPQPAAHKQSTTKYPCFLLASQPNHPYSHMRQLNNKPSHSTPHIHNNLWSICRKFGQLQPLFMNTQQIFLKDKKFSYLSLLQLLGKEMLVVHPHLCPDSTNQTKSPSNTLYLI